MSKKKNRKIKERTSPWVLPEHSTAHHKNMRHMKRFIASNALLLGPLNQKQKNIVKGIRQSEAFSTFVDFKYQVRGPEALKLRPFDRDDGNYGMLLWRDDARKLNAPFLRYYVKSQANPAMAQRIANYKSGKSSDPLLLITDNPACTEHQALQRFMDRHDPSKKKVSGTLSFYTERFPCKSCTKVIEQFLEKQKDVIVFIAYEFSFFNPEDNETAKRMMRDNLGRLRLTALKHRPTRFKHAWMRKTPAKRGRRQRHLTQTLRTREHHHNAAPDTISAATTAGNPGIGLNQRLRAARLSHKMALNEKHPETPNRKVLPATHVVPRSRVLIKLKKRNRLRR